MPKPLHLLTFGEYLKLPQHEKELVDAQYLFVEEPPPHRRRASSTRNWDYAPSFGTSQTNAEFGA